MKSEREIIIRNSLNRWHNNNCLGIIQAATGLGKTYAAILAIELFVKENPNDQILIVCPTETVILNFTNEFSKFKKKNLLSYCKFICYASLTKEIEYYSLVILDEVHHIVTENKLKFFRNIKTKGILGLSASLTKEQILELRRHKMPVVYKFTLEQAKAKDFVANFTIINVPIDLTLKERIQYNYITSKIDYAKAKSSYTDWGNINKRKSIVNNADSKFCILKDIVDLFENEYGVIFTLEKESTDRVVDIIGDTCLSIHSGISRKVIAANLSSFSDGRTKVKQLATAKMLDEGVTLPRISYGIGLSRHSTERQGIQTTGRLVRNDIEGKHSIFIRLYCKDTIEENWVRESQTNVKVTYVKDYEELKNKISEIRSKNI